MLVNMQATTSSHGMYYFGSFVATFNWSVLCVFHVRAYSLITKGSNNIWNQSFPLRVTRHHRFDLLATFELTRGVLCTFSSRWLEWMLSSDTETDTKNEHNEYAKEPFHWFCKHFKMTIIMNHLLVHKNTCIDTSVIAWHLVQMSRTLKRLRSRINKEIKLGGWN